MDEQLSLARALMQPLFEKMSASKDLSNHSRQLMQALVLFTGAFLISIQERLKREDQEEGHGSAVAEVPHGSLLDIGSSSPAPVAPVPQRRNHTEDVESVLCFLAEELASAQGLEWGCGLLHPTIEQSLRLKLVSNSVSLLLQNPSTTEGEFLGVLRQVPWQDLPDIADAELVKQEVEIPLKKLSELAGPRKYNGLLVAIGNIFMLCAAAYRERSFDYISAISSGHWPMKLVCSGVLHSSPLANLDRDQLAAVFGNLYNLSRHLALDYSKLAESARLQHREEFVKYILSYPMPAELRGPRAPSNQPVLFTFYQIAGHVQEGSYLQRLIVQELFFHAFSLYVPRCAKSEAHVVSTRQWQGEATSLLSALCLRFPALLSTVIYSIGQNLGSINVDTLKSFLQAEGLFDNWQADQYSVNWLAFMFGQRAFPNIAEGADPDSIAQMQFETLLCQKPTANFNPQLAEIGRNLGQTLFGAIRWRTATAATRLQAAVVLVGGCRIHPPGAILEKLLGSLGQELITAPLDKSFVNAILHGNLEACATPMSVIFLQLLVGLAIVEEQYEFARINQRPRQPNEGYRWLASWGFFARAQQLLSSPNTRPLLPRLLIRLDVLKEEPDLVAGPVKEFLEVVVQHNKAETQEARMALCESLLVSLQQNGTEDLDHSIADAEVAAMLADERREKRLSFWYRVLTPSSKNDTTILAMLDDLIAYCYCSGDSLEGAKTLQAMNLSRDDIVSLRASRYFWVMLLSLFTFTPTYPSNARDKQNAFHLLHETATQLNTEAAAVAYWLQMFMVFHGAPPSIVVAPPQLQERLSKRFVAVAKHFEGSDPQLHKLYYAFSTWKKGIIDASTGDFHEEQNIWILDSLYRLLPPRFQVKAPNRNKAPIDKPVFKPFVNAETVDKVVAMLPVPVQRPPNKLAEDMERYVNLEHAISNAVAYFHSIREGSFRIGEPVEVPAVQQLHFLLQGYSAAAAGLRQLDEQFLDFTTKSHYNHQAPFQVRVACTRGTDQCKQPAILQGVSVRVEPQQPGVLQAIQANRQTYNTKYVQFFDIARTVAQAVVLLKHSLSQAIGTLSPQLAVALFFTIAEHMIVSGVVAPDTAIARHVVEVLMLLGERHIRQNREVQPPLLELLLRVPAPQKKQPTPMRAAPSNQSASAAPAPLASDSADVEARRASGQAVDAEGSRFAAGMLFTLFTPRCFIQVGDSRAYLQTLQTLCRSPRSDEAIAPFSRCFSAEDYLSVLGQSPSEEDVSFIFNVLPDLLSRPVFSEVGSAFLRFLVERGQQRRVLGLLFSQHVAPEFASRFLTNVSSSSLDLSTAQTMLTNFATSLPVASGPAATVGMSLVRKFTLECEAFMAEFKRQTAEAYDDQRRPVESELWRLVAALFSRNGLLSEITPSSDEQLAIVLDLLLELVLASPEGLVDKCWYLITASVLPALSAHTQARGQLPHTDAVLARMGESLPWHLSKILFYDRNAIEAMSAGVSQQATFVATVFGKLSWQQFFTQLRSAPDATMVSEVAVAYLRLFLTVATLSPASIPQNVRNLTSFVAKREAVHTVTPFVDWPSVDAGIFAAAFDGEALLQPVKAGLARSDPSTALMENVFLLRDIALQMNDARAGVAVVREVRSLLFFAVECGPEEYWYLSLPGQTAILSGALVPLTHHFGAESRETKEMALSVVSCLLNTKWPTPYLLPVRGLSNARTYPGAPGVQEAAFDEFQEKVRGLVLQCCHTASPILALHVLRVAPLPNYATDQVDDSSVSPGLWVDLLEQTLRSYFRATEDDLPLTQVASSVQLYIADRSFMIATCRESRSAFALFAVLQQWRKEFMEHSGDRWPAPLLDAALGFVADQYRDFDILLMWFLFLDLAADRRFFPVQCQQEVRGPPPPSRTLIRLLLT